MTEDRVIGGRYRLGAELGRGGMGTVWAARDEVLGRDVAVKEVVAPPSLAEEDRRLLRERTMREARAAARVDSPSAVTVFDVVEEGGRPWVVMELLPARSLADVLRQEGTVSPPRAAAIGLDVLSALTAAHRAGVLHRDVKPSNVMVDDERAVLADFGIATLDGDPSLTSTGMIVGSPSYMAPERARGAGPSPASDLWSLGATLFTAVQGRPPFERDSQLATLAAVVGEDTPAAPAAGPLEPVLRALLAKEPADRPGPDRLRAMLEEAAAAPEPEPGPADRPSGPESPGRPVAVSDDTTPVPVPVPTPRPRRRPPALLLALVALLTVVAGVLAWDALREPAGSGTDVTAESADPSAANPPAEAPAEPADPEQGDQAQGDQAQGDQAQGDQAQGDQAQGDQEQPAAPTDQLPAGFTRHEDPSGFSIAVPEGWEVSTEGPRTYFRDPQSSRYLMVDQTTEPADDALADWEQNEQGVAQRLSDYQRVSMERVAYRDYDAVDWEFTFAGDSDRVHVLNRNVRVSDERAYAIYWSTPEAAWADGLPVFQAAVDSFRPAG